MPMSKSSLSVLAKAISSKNGMTPAEAERFIQKMFEVANDAINEDKQLKVKWLGTFKITSVKDRESVDVNTGDRIVIEGRDKITFTPDNILKEIINKPFAQFETVVVNDGVDFSDIDEKFAKMEEEDAAAEVSAIKESVAVGNSENDSVSEIANGIQMQTSAEDLVTQIENSVSEENLADMDLPEKQISETISPEEQEPETISFEEKTTENKKEEVGADDNIEEENVAEEIPTDASVSAQPSVNEVPSDASLSARPSEDVIPESNSVDVHVEVNDAATEKSNSEQVAAAPAVSIRSTEEMPQSEIAQEEKEYIIEASNNGNNVEEAEAPFDEEESSDKHHFVIPKYMVAIVCLAFIALLGGMGWFAFNYGKMQAQRDHLASQLEGMKSQSAMQVKAQKPAPAPVDSAQLALNEKARQDSIRMAAASQAIEKAEESRKAEETEKEEAAKAEVAAKAAAKSDKTPQGSINDKALASKSPYDNDPRVRTGAYRIVGVAQNITVKAGQTLESLSKTYLGPGMECYVEAVNGTTEVKAGQKLKIPKLELKKKK